MSNQSSQRRLPVGAEVQPSGGVHFHVRAPRRRSVMVALRHPSNNETLAEIPLSAEGGGYFSGYSADATDRSRYGFRLDDDSKLYPGPASRRQSDGPHELSEIRRPGCDAVFSAQRANRIHGAVLAAEAFLLRYLGEDGDDRLVLVNLGCDLEWSPTVEPLLAPPAGREWRTLCSGEDPRYGGSGTPRLDAYDWFLPGHAAIVLAAHQA